MIRFPLLSLVLLLSPLAFGQVPAAAPGPLVPTAATKKPTNAKPVVRPPKSAQPTPINRLSTAERAALIHDKPQVRQLPTFTLNDRDGNQVTAQSLPQITRKATANAQGSSQSGAQATPTTHWLLLYRGQDCLPCDRLMTVLAESDSPSFQAGQHYVIVVAPHTSDGVERVRANYSKLNAATWLTDNNKQIVTALKPQGEPMLYALDGNNIIWRVPGNLGNPAKVEQLASSWMSSTSPSSTAPSNSTSAAKAAPVPASAAAK
jgi:hypothetical protein